VIGQCRLCAKLQDCVKLDPAIFAGDCSAYIQNAPWGRKNEPVSFVNKFFNIRNVISQKFSRLVVSLSLVSEITERVFKSRLMDYLTCNSLLNSHQSAYCKHHSTETALLYIHDHLVSATGSQKYHVFAYLTFLLLLTLLTMTSWSPVSHPGLVSMALFSAGSSRICHLVTSEHICLLLFSFFCLTLFSCRFRAVD